MKLNIKQQKSLKMKIYSSYRFTHSNGFSAISMVIILMVLGFMLLAGFNLLITSWQKSIIIERIYYSRFNHASSSLHWAITQNWPIPTLRWHCQTEPVYHFKGCIKQSRLLIDNYVLVRGEHEGFFLYTLAHYHGNKLIVEKGHWLDYCPEKKSRDCE